MHPNMGKAKELDVHIFVAGLLFSITTTKTISHFHEISGKSSRQKLGDQYPYQQKYTNTSSAGDCMSYASTLPIKENMEEKGQCFRFSIES